MTSGTFGAANEATRGSVIRLGAEVSVRSVRLCTAFLLVVGLGAEGYGLWAALWGIAVLLAEAADLGLRMVACPVVVGDRTLVADVVRTKVRLLGAALAVLLAAAALSRLAFGPPAADMALALVALTVAATFATAVELGGVLLRALGRRLEEALVLLLLSAGGLAAVVVVLAGAPAVSLSRLRDIGLALAVSSVLALSLAGRWLRHAGAWGDAATRGARALLSLSLPLGLNGALALATMRVEILMLLFWRGPLETGLFAAALKLLELLNAVPGALAAGALPALTRETALQQGAARQRTAATVLILAMPATLGLCLLAPQAAVRVGYAGATVPLRLLSLAVVPMFLNAAALHTLLAAGRGALLPRLTGVRLLAGVLLGVFLIPGFGGAGAALGLALSEWLLLALALRACALAGVGIPLSTFLGRRSSPRLVAEGAHAG
jgi:O-antigen/teichoic acid export membrane protein